MDKSNYKLYTIGRDEVVYATPDHTVSNSDTLTMRRTASKKRTVKGGAVELTPQRINYNFSKTIEGQLITLSITSTIVPGTDTAQAKTFFSEALTAFAEEFAGSAISGDITRSPFN